MDPEDPAKPSCRALSRRSRGDGPRAFVMENVKALAVNARWAAIRERLLDRATELGDQRELFVVNAADYGVPQARERMFLIGIRGVRPTLPKPSSSGCQPTVREALAKLARVGEPGNDGLCTARVVPAENPGDAANRVPRQSDLQWIRTANHARRSVRNYPERRWGATRRRLSTKRSLSLAPRRGWSATTSVYSAEASLSRRRPRGCAGSPCRRLRRCRPSLKAGPSTDPGAPSVSADRKRRASKARARDREDGAHQAWSYASEHQPRAELEPRTRRGAKGPNPAVAGV